MGLWLRSLRRGSLLRRGEVCGQASTFGVYDSQLYFRWTLLRIRMMTEVVRSYSPLVFRISNAFVPLIL